MKKIYKVRWCIIVETDAAYETKQEEVYKATKESAVLTVQNIKSAFEDLGFTKEQIQPITIEEVELT